MEALGISNSMVSTNSISSIPATPQDVTIPARDGVRLLATVFPADGPRVLLVNSATATPRAYYRGFAQYFADRGVATVIYDYRGISGSRPPGPLRNVQATMRDWVDLDARAVMDWTLARFPGRKLLVVGHSFGGQVLGLLPRAAEIHRVALVASQLGYWRLFAPKDRRPAWLAMHVILPTLSRVLGYFPGSKLGLGEDLPKGVALEWARWCRSPQYLFDHLEAQEHQGYRAFRAPMLAYKITDDTFASANSVDALLPYYPQARPLLRTVSPQELGVKSLGHFGPFRSVHSATLWPELFAWLVHEKAPVAAKAIA
jgi:predicted alpha/beta hydrolase